MCARVPPNPLNENGSDDHVHFMMLPLPARRCPYMLAGAQPDHDDDLSHRHDLSYDAFV